MNKLLCLFFGHKYFSVQELTPRARRVCCSRCSKSFAMNDELEILVDWDSDFHRLYEGHGISIEYIDFEFSKI